MSTAAAASAVTKHPILLIHGYGMCGASMMSKTGALRSEVKKLPFEFFAVDGPFDCINDAPVPARPPTPPQIAETATNNSNDDDNSTAQKVAAGLPANLTLEPNARAWYSFQNVDATSRYEKFEQGFQFIIDHCAERDKQGLPPYRGVFAFSQGTIMATILAARVQNYKKYLATKSVSENEKEQEEGKSTQKQEQQQPVKELPPFMTHFDFVVLASGLLPKDIDLRQEILSSAPFTIPSLHIVGKTDRLVDPLKTIELAGLFDEKNKVLWEHEGGHVIPSQARKPFKVLLEKMKAELN